jgi:hypothetical protein
MPWSASTRSAARGVPSVRSANGDGPAGSPSTVERNAVGSASPRASTSPPPSATWTISRSCATRTARRTPPALKRSALRAESESTAP